MKPIILSLFVEVAAFALGATFAPPEQYLMWLWIAVAVHFVLVVLLFRRNLVVYCRDRLHIGYKTIKQGEDQLQAKKIAEQNQRREKLADHIRAMSQSGFLGSPLYDAETGTMSADVQLPYTWRNRVIDYAIWLVRHRLLPKKFYIGIGQRLGYRIKPSPKGC